MGLSIEETVVAINKLSDLITQNIPDIAQDVAAQSKSLIQERIQEFGLNAEESALTAYSPAYKKVRAKKGLQINHVDLTVHGADGMWFTTNIISQGDEGKGYQVTVGGANSFTKNKLGWNSERYGDILEMSELEKDKAVILIDAKLTELIKEAGL